MFKRLLLSAILLVGAASAALAQPVNVVPQVGFIAGLNGQRATYSSVALALPPAASATDVACIAGSASKTIEVKEITVSGSAGTLVTLPITLVRRASVNTGGTAGTTTANWASNIAKHDTNSPTAAATLISYSANPTITDSSPTYLRSNEVTVPVTSAGTSVAPIVWRFGDTTGAIYDLPLTLRGAAQQFCLNFNGVSISSGLMHLSIMWTEY